MESLGDLKILMWQDKNITNSGVVFCLVDPEATSPLFEREISVARAGIEQKFSTGHILTPIKNKYEVDHWIMTYPTLAVCLFYIDDAKKIAHLDGISVWKETLSVWI